MSCKCQSCGNLYKIDLIIPDKLWEIIKPQNKAKGAGLLCGECIIKLLESSGEYGALQLGEAANSTSTNNDSPKLPKLIEWYDFLESKIDGQLSDREINLVSELYGFVARQLSGIS